MLDNHFLSTKPQQIESLTEYSIMKIDDPLQPDLDPQCGFYLFTTQSHVYLFATHSRLLTLLEKKALENVVGEEETGNQGYIWHIYIFGNVFYSSHHKF